MGTASSIHSVPQDNGRTSFCTDFLRDTTCGKPFSGTFNLCYPLQNTEKSSRSYANSSRSKTKQPIKIDAGNLNKAILLQIVNRCTSKHQQQHPDYEDCNVPLSTEGSHKNTKAHGAHHLLNKLDFDKFDANKTTTNSLDTSCIKSSPKATVFHPQAAIYFEYDKSSANQMARINQDYEPTPDISWEGPLYTQENPEIRSQRTNYNEGNTSRSTKSINKENDLPFILNPEKSQRSNREEIKPQIFEKTPQKQPQEIFRADERITRRLNLKSRSATRHMNSEITPEPKVTEIAASASIFQFKGDPLLRNYGMISELPGPKRLERLLNSDSKASMPPSGRLTHTEKSEEMQQSLRSSNSKPIPKHKLLLQANKMKRERSCELLSTGGAQSLGTRETTGPELISAGRGSLRATDLPLPRFTSPSKTEDSVVALAQQEQLTQVEGKWQEFHASVSQMKKEMGEVKKQNAWLEEHQRDISHQKSQNVSHTASPMHAGDPRITHFTHATLSLSSSIPHYNNDTNQKSTQDLIPSFAERLKDSVEQGHRLSPLREERLSVIREDRAERMHLGGHQNGESFNTQHFGTGTVDIQALQLKNSMETFDPPSSCYESNITYQLDKDRDNTCVVDLLAKDNNSEYNRENYQSVISDINQKIDGILKKCNIITEKSNRSLQQRTLLSNSPNPTFVDGVGDMILDDPALMTETNEYIAARASPENVAVVENLRNNKDNNEIENIIGQCYTEILRAPENQGLVTMKDDVFVKQAIQPYPVEVDKSFESSGKYENPCIDSEPKIIEKEEEEEIEQEKNYMSRNYRQSVEVIEEVEKENPKDHEYLRYLKDLKGQKQEEVEVGEQQIEDYPRRRTEGSLGTMRKSVENVEVEEESQVSSANFPQLAEQIDHPKQIEENVVRVEDTFSVRSDNRNLSMYGIHTTARNEREEEEREEEEEKTVQHQVLYQNNLENSFSQETRTQRSRYESPVKFPNIESKTETPVKQMQQIALNCSPQRREESPEKTTSHNSPSQIQNEQDWNPSKYPTLEIQRAAEELEALSKALNDLPQQADNFVSTAGLNAVKQTIMEKIEGIHGDILQRIGQLNKKVETRSPLGHQRRNSVLDQTQDTRKFEYSTEIDPRRVHSSIKEGSRSPYSFSSQAKSESQPQSYCPSPFQSQPREQPRTFEPGLTFGHDNLEWKGQQERAALEKLKKSQQKEKLAKFEPKQVNVSLMNLIDTSGDISGFATTQTKSTAPCKVDKIDKHQQSIKQIAEHNTNSKQSSPLSYRSSLLKSATRDGAIKINRTNKSNERDNDLETVLSSTLRRDSSSEKETKKTKSQQNSQRGLLSSQQLKQQEKMPNEKEIREAFNLRQPSSPLYMSQILGTDPNSQKSRRGSYSEAKNVTTMDRSAEMWVQEEIEKKKKLAVELMNLSSLRKTRELEMPEDCMRKMEEWARSETSSWSQIPTVREKKIPSQGVLKVQDYLVSEGKAGTRELGEYPMSALLAKENQESDDTIFEECDTKRISTRDQGVQTVNRIVENFYLKQRRESKENGRGGGLSSLQSSMIDHSLSTSTIPIVSKRNQSQVSIEYNTRTSGMKTPERRRTSSKNICLSDLEVLDTKRMSIGNQDRSASRLMTKKSMSRALEKQATQNKANKSGEKDKYYKSSNDRTSNGLPRVSKSVRDNAIAISELMQAYVLEQKERSYK